MKNLLIKTIILSSLSVSSFGIECTNRLNNSLRELPSWMLSTPSQDKLHSQCVTVSMRQFSAWTDYFTNKRASQGKPTPGHYLYCEDGLKNRSNSSPCRTEAYVNSIHNSYNTVLECLDLSSDDLLPLIAVESGFHLNAVSIFGVDIGIGQLTPPAITDVNTNWENYSLELNSGKASCQKIINFMNNQNVEMPVASNYECALTKTPENPMMNLLYTGLFYKTITGYIETFFAQSDVINKMQVLKGRELKDSELARIKKRIVALTYNMGYPNSGEAFSNYLDYLSTRMNSVSDSFDFVEVNKNSTSFGGYLKNKGLSSYLNLIIDRLKTLRRKTDKNVSCFKTF